MQNEFFAPPALRVYRHIGDAGMAMSVESIIKVENKKLVAGHVAELLGDFDKAQVSLVIGEA